MKIVLIGFMGSGKSTVGKLLASALGYQFIEMDEEIIKRSGYSTISEIFTAGGEERFRQLETEVALSLASMQRAVISAGGGTPTREANMHALKAGESSVFYLDCSIEQICMRIGDTSNRPLFRDLSRAKELYTLRLPLYQRYADFIVSAEGSAESVCRSILGLITDQRSIPKQCYIIGNPVAHSLSPSMHNAGYQVLGIEKLFCYSPLQVLPEELSSIIGAFRTDSFRGASCTMPHKESVIPLLDWIDPLAKTIGAVNTIVYDGQLLRGYNTDWIGIIEPLKSRIDLAGKQVLIVGAGGAARAAIVGLLASNAKVSISNRTLSKAESLASLFHISTVNWEERIEPKIWDIIINTSSVGMGETADESPLEGYQFQSSQIVFETIYNPRTTKLLKDAAAAGAKTIAGLEMLLHQGFAQFELFTGRDAPREAMRRAIGG